MGSDLDGGRAKAPVADSRSVVVAAFRSRIRFEDVREMDSVLGCDQVRPPGAGDEGSLGPLRYHMWRVAYAVPTPVGRVMQPRRGMDGQRVNRRHRVDDRY